MNLDSIVSTIGQVQILNLSALTVRFGEVSVKEGKRVRIEVFLLSFQEAINSGIVQNRSMRDIWEMKQHG